MISVSCVKSPSGGDIATLFTLVTLGIHCKPRLSGASFGGLLLVTDKPLSQQRGQLLSHEGSRLVVVENAAPDLGPGRTRSPSSQESQDCLFLSVARPIAQDVGGRTLGVCDDRQSGQEVLGLNEASLIDHGGRHGQPERREPRLD